MKNLIKIAIASLFCLSLPASASQVDLPVICGHESFGVQDESIYGVLTYGLTWFGEEATNPNVSYCSQSQSRYFDSNKKHTMIFIHGFAPFSAAPFFLRPYSTRFDFNANDIHGPAVSDLVAPWLKGSFGDHQPWNVGVFYWNQFADEHPDLSNITQDTIFQSTQAAEAKIWRVNGPDNMVWRNDKDEIMSAPQDIHKDVTQLFVDQYIAELKNYAQQNPTADIRLVGESLGAQMVIHGAKLIADAVNDPANQLPKNLIPNQVVLLDPMVTEDNGDETRLNTLIADVNALKQQGVVLSGYRTSNLGVPTAQTEGHVSDNTKLLSLTAFSDLEPSGCVYPGTDMTASTNQHTFGIWWYLLSYTLPQGPAVTSEVGNESAAPFANMSVANLKALMNSPTKFVSDNETAQAAGECTDPSTPEDPAAIAKSLKQWASWPVKAVDKSESR